MKKSTLVLIIIFSILAIDLPVMLAYQSSLATLQFSNHEQINTLNYLKNKEPLTVDYTENEISHLQDVQKLMVWANRYFLFLIIVEIFILIVVFQTEKKYFYQTFLYGGLVSFSLLTLTLLWALLDFNSIFNLFHQIFFPMGNWTFSAESKLITLFSPAFFYNLTKEIFIKSIIFSVLMIIVGLILKRQK